MKVSIDTNVLFDILLDDPDFAEGSREALYRALQDGPVVICPVVYAELASSFLQDKDLTEFLHDLQIKTEGWEGRSLWLAGQAWAEYARRRGKQVQCPRCGKPSAVTCPKCKQGIAWRQRIVSDFLIGAHASAQADALLTRDRGYYKTYFPDLVLQVP